MRHAITAVDHAISDTYRASDTPFHAAEVFASADRSKKIVIRKRLREAEEEQQLRLLRCIFGNPFRPIPFDPRWRSESAVALARVAYDTRNFSLLPILADALEDAGCDSPAALAHLREPDAPHARGCWVVDLVLGK